MRPKRVVINGTQECIGCHQWLPLDRFHKHKPSSTGHAWRCKECHKQTLLGGLTPSQRAQKWAKENPARYSQLAAESRHRILHDERRLENRRNQSNSWYHFHKKQAIKSHANWRRNNPWTIIADRARTLVRATVHGSLDGGKKFQSLTGTTGTHFRKHLESLWLPDMSWPNFGRGGWTIGHIKPVVQFKDVLHTAEGLQACFHYSNLQPEWERSNLAKFTKDSLTTAQQSLSDRHREVSKNGAV